MSKIKVMDEILANKIAAGEVVEKTMNVVKELVENAIDAESDEIKIELIDSGVKEVKVTDNGIGMDRDDATLAFSRHACIIKLFTTGNNNYSQRFILQYSSKIKIFKKFIC